MTPENPPQHDAEARAIARKADGTAHRNCAEAAIADALARETDAMPPVAKHTPGPWRRGTESWDGTEYMVIENTDGAVICMEPTEFFAYASGAFITPDGYAPNFDLITAAPELLAACQNILAAINCNYTAANLNSEYGDAIRAAIANATGEAVQS